MTLQFINGINNDSLQIGDMAYFQTPSVLGGFNQQLSAPIFIGPVVDIFDINGISVSQPEWNPPMFSMQVDEINPGGTTNVTVKGLTSGIVKIVTVAVLKTESSSTPPDGTEQYEFEQDKDSYQQG